MDKDRLLTKYGYHLAIGLGDMNDLELYRSWQEEETELAYLTLEDAAYVLEVAYDELHKFQDIMAKKSEGWEALKHAQ